MPRGPRLAAHGSRGRLPAERRSEGELVTDAGAGSSPPRPSARVVAGVCAWGLTADRLDGVQNRWEDLLQPGLASSDDVVVVGIDRASLAATGSGWPWPRDLHAELLAAIGDGDPAVVVYDVLFADSRPGDDALVDAMRRTPTVLPTALTLTVGSDGPPEIVDAVVPADPLAAAAAGLGPRQHHQRRRYRRRAHTAAVRPRRARHCPAVDRPRCGVGGRRSDRTVDGAAARRPGRRSLRPPRRRRAADQLVGDAGATTMSSRRSTCSADRSTPTCSATALSSWASRSRHSATRTLCRRTAQAAPRASWCSPTR